MPVIVAVLVNLGQNMALWFAALWVYRLTISRRQISSRREALVLGALAGGLGLLGIAAPVEVAPGIFVDSRAPLILLAGALEALWSSHVRAEVADESQRGFNRGNASRAETLEEHRQMLEQIERGDTEAVRTIARAHLERVNPRRLTQSGRLVDITGLRPRF